MLATRPRRATSRVLTRVWIEVRGFRFDCPTPAREPPFGRIGIVARLGIGMPSHVRCARCLTHRVMGSAVCPIGRLVRMSVDVSYRPCRADVAGILQCGRHRGFAHLAPPQPG